MKVEFTVEEIHAMFEEVVDQIVAIDLDKKDRAAIRRWAAADMKSGEVLMRRLSDKINEQIQHAHDRSEVSPIKKPDWAE